MEAQEHEHEDVCRDLHTVGHDIVEVALLDTETQEVVWVLAVFKPDHTCEEASQVKGGAWEPRPGIFPKIRFLYWVLASMVSVCFKDGTWAEAGTTSQADGICSRPSPELFSQNCCTGRSASKHILRAESCVGNLIGREVANCVCGNAKVSRIPAQLFRSR